MANMREVAKKAGVGVGTVSRVLNHSGYVAEETRNKILQAMQELEYSPSSYGTRDGKKTGLVGVVIPDIEHPFFSRMMRCFDEELAQRGYKSVLCNTINIVNRQMEMLKMLDEHKLDGLIVCGDPPRDFKGRKGKPIVSLDRYWTPDVPVVRSDHTMGGTLVAEAFMKKGCRKIIQFLGENGYEHSADLRHRVLEEILKKNGGEVISVILQWDLLDYSHNKQVVEKYWEVIRKTDGCFTNDVGALSCLGVARQKGVRVPEDFKIIAFDGTELTKLLIPEVTTLQQDCQGLAKKSVELLVDMIQGKQPEKEIYEIPITLIERGTT